MDEVPRIFTLEEANDLVSTLEVEFGRIARLRGELVPLVESLGGPEVAMAILQGERETPPGRDADLERLKDLAAAVAEVVERVNVLGCLVKDVELGLVDFYSMRENEPVFLCWQFGEPAVTHWHHLDEGFTSRQPVEGIEVEPPEYFN
jgi:hypothetical protein